MDEEVKSHYASLFKKHGDSIESVQWSDRATQFRRFEILAEGILEQNAKIVDLGCGLGNFLEFLNSKSDRKFDSYLGLDFVESFIERATQVFGTQKNASFRLFDAQKDAYPNGYDYFVMSGIFFVKTQTNWSELTSTISQSFAACNRGIAFNLLSTYVDYQQPGHYHVDPSEIFEYCKRTITPRVTLRHDYLIKKDTIPYEYTVYLYK
jgi:SAM-dependent methyltransferase